jgi:valyl-tRNA synthetase
MSFRGEWAVWVCLFERLLSTATPGQDTSLSDAPFEAGKRTAHKLWNAARFVLGAWERAGQPCLEDQSLAADDIALLARMEAARDSTIADLLERRWKAATHTWKTAMWDDLCDGAIEARKDRLRNGDTAAAATLHAALWRLLEGGHPLLPFTTARIGEAMGAHDLARHRLR